VTLFVTLLVGLVLAGCNESGSETNNDSANDNENDNNNDDTATITLASFSPNADVLAEVIEAFESETGHTVSVRWYVGETEDSEEAAIRAGNSADLVAFPQPGRINALREDGFLEALQPEIFNEYGNGPLVDLVTHDSQMYGFPYAFNVKSIIWYSRSAFDDAQIDVPQSYAEFETMLADLANSTDSTDDTIPDNLWCIGLEGAMSAGDWFEEVLLQTRGVDVYNQWTSGENFDYKSLEFDIEGVLENWKTDYLNNANSDLELDPFWEAPRGLLVGQRDCFLHTQASWITPIYQADITDVEDQLATSEDSGDIDFLAIPAPEGEDNALRRIGGEFLVKVSDHHVVDEFIAFVATDQSRRMIAEAGLGKLPNFASQSGEEVTDAIADNYILNKLNQWYLDNGVNGEVFDGTDLLSPAEAKRIEDELKRYATTDQSSVDTLETLENPE